MGSSPPPPTSAHRPPFRRGVIARPVPDWFSEQAMGGQMSQDAQVATPWQISLVNNDPQGRAFAVYGARALSKTAGVTALFTVSPAHPIGAQFRLCAPIFVPGEQATGTLLLESTNVPTAGIVWQMPATAPGAEWPHDFPLAVVGPSLALYCICDTQNADISFAVWFVPIDE